jgi:hypothetical protein
MIKEAKHMSVAELDHEIGDEQHRLAAQFYNGNEIEVEVKKERFTVHFEACECITSGPGYRTLSLMKGTEFNKLPKSSEQDRTLCKAIALAVMEKELCLMLSGQQFDCDRHGNQVRIDIQDNHIHLGLYDFGEMSLNPLNEEEVQSLAALIKELPARLLKGDSIDGLFQKHIDLATKNSKPCQHLMRINKGLLALQDFQKELDMRDLKALLYKIRNKIHPELNKALMEGALQNINLSALGGFFRTRISQTFNLISESYKKAMSETCTIL